MHWHWNISKLGDDAKAENYLKNILNSEPAYIGSYYHLAKLLERNDKTDEAIKYMKKEWRKQRKREIIMLMVN